MALQVPLKTASIEEKAKYVWDTADTALEDEVDSSYIFKVLQKKCHEFPVFAGDSEITTGQILGKGGFSFVYEITNINLLQQQVDTKKKKIPMGRSGVNSSTYHIPEQSKDEDLDGEEEQDLQTSMDFSFQQRHQYDDDTTKARHYDIKEARTIMQKRATRFGHSRYAMKRLRPDLSNGLDYARGAIDLAIEIKFMSVLAHPNIVKMRGLSANTPRVSLDTFIIMDRLYGTLEDKIDEEWVQRNHELTSQWHISKEVALQKTKRERFCCGWMCQSKNKKEDADDDDDQDHNTSSAANFQKRYEYDTTQLLKDRLLVAYDLTVAFQYMHDLRLIYRDIKPQNVGFDIRGDVKVFDFGLMKSMDDRIQVLQKVRHDCGDSKDEECHPNYKLTGFTGSIPYMAPEIALRKPYNQKCDVFSFSMLFYEMITLEFLFPDYRIKDYYTRVCQNEERPTFRTTTTNTTTERKNNSKTTTKTQEGSDIWNSIPTPIQTIIEEGWSVNPSQRPEMKQIGIVLRGLLLTMVAQLEESCFCIDTDGNCRGLDDGDAIRNRTQHMMNRSHASTTTSSSSCRLTSHDNNHPRPTSRCVNAYGMTPARTVGKNKNNQNNNNTMLLLPKQTKKEESVMVLYVVVVVVVVFCTTTQHIRIQMMHQDLPNYQDYQ